MVIQYAELAGIDPRCEFHYPPYAWATLVPILVFGTDEQVNEAIAQLEARDRALEDHLANRPCCECPDDGGGEG